jgi:hypothetical protein
MIEASNDAVISRSDGEREMVRERGKASLLDLTACSTTARLSIPPVPLCS